MDDERIVGEEEIWDEILELETDSTTKFKWCEKSTRLLINLRLSKEKQFVRPICKKKKLWGLIADKMLQIGKYKVSSNECDIKYRNMLATYKKNKKRSNESGQENINWPYFETFDKALGTKTSINPPACIIGSSIENDSNISEEPEVERIVQEQQTGKGKGNVDGKMQYLTDKLEYKKKESDRKAKEWEEKK